MEGGKIGGGGMGVSITIGGKHNPASLVIFFFLLFTYNNIFCLHERKPSLKGKFFATYELYQNLRESLWVEDSIGSYGDVIRFWWTPPIPRRGRGPRAGEESPREDHLSDYPMYCCDVV